PLDDIAEPRALDRLIRLVLVLRSDERVGRRGRGEPVGSGQLVDRRDCDRDRAERLQLRQRAEQACGARPSGGRSLREADPLGERFEAACPAADDARQLQAGEKLERVLEAARYPVDLVKCITKAVDNVRDVVESLLYVLLDLAARLHAVDPVRQLAD